MTAIETGLALAIWKVIGAELFMLYVESPWKSAVAEYVPAVSTAIVHRYEVVGGLAPIVDAPGKVHDT